MSEKLPRLYYLSNNEPNLLPEWAYFFLNLGYQLATVPNINYRLVSGLAIPSRVFACGLVATGIAFAKASTKNSINTVQRQYILDLEPGTPVYVRRDNNRKLKGVIERFEDYNGEPYIYIRTTESGTHGFPLDGYASRITVSDHEIKLPKHQQSGYLIETPSEFLNACLGKELVHEYILNSSFEALIVGKVAVIQYEVCEISFICKTSSKTVGTTGYLQDIMRVRQFSGANKSYRIQCISSSNETLENEISNGNPPVVIFDGAVAYIKHGHKWRNAHHIVLLDRTERQFMDAKELLNQNYAYRLADDFKFPINIPNGIEMMIYKEQK